MGIRSAWIAVIVSALAVSTAAAQQQAMDRLEQLGGALRAHAVWRASYHQVYVAAGMTSGEEVDGTVWVAWPDRALFVSGEPAVRLMGLAGRQVRLVDLESGSCDVHRLSDEEWARVPLAAVLDPAHALDSFAVLGHGERGFALVPREPGGVTRLEVTLGPDSLPEEVLVEDPQGASNRLRFSGWSAQEAEPQGGWLPPPPSGVVCTDDSGAGPD